MAWRVEIFLIFQKMKLGGVFCSDVFLFSGIEEHLKKDCGFKVERY